jgi:hypothetical protein
MLKQAILQCPDALWLDTDYQNPFWHVAYHVLFYTHFYLGNSEETYIPWEKHRDGIVSLKADVAEEPPRSKGELLTYLDHCREMVEQQVPALDLEAESGFYWLPFDKLELQLYNIRHIQQHTGELHERLGARGEIEIDWVGMKPDKV